MKPRITISIAPDGELHILLNEEGRNLLIKELQALAPNRSNDHFHMGSWEGSEVGLSAIPYYKDDQIIHSAKVLFRPD